MFSIYHNSKKSYSKEIKKTRFSIRASKKKHTPLSENILYSNMLFKKKKKRGSKFLHHATL